MRSEKLIAAADPLPRREAERLLALATGLSRSRIIVGADITAEHAELFWAYVERRRGDEPLQYIEGIVPFGTVTLEVDSRVLVPRPETEYLLELVVARVSNPSVIVDLCTGSGNLALALKAEFPGAEVHATELSGDAVAVARSNAQRNELDIAIHHGDLFDPLPSGLRGRVDLVVANPPYLAASEVEDLPGDVLKEPRGALVAGDAGDEIVERIGAEASEWVAAGGVVACEVSEFHADRVAPHFVGFEMSVVHDLAGRDRFVIGRHSFD